MARQKLIGVVANPGEDDSRTKMLSNGTLINTELTKRRSPHHHQQQPVINKQSGMLPSSSLSHGSSASSADHSKKSSSRHTQQTRRRRSSVDDVRVRVHARKHVEDRAGEMGFLCPPTTPFASMRTKGSRRRSSHRIS